MAEKNKLSPVMQQYVDMKAENPDALLMFRLGDFYEAFFEDAKTVSETLSLVLTHRGTDGFGENVPMCGIPWHASDNYFGRLVKSGYKVALVEQMETPQQAKQRGHKFIERKVIRVLTPGTLTDENLLTPKKSNFLVAIVSVDEKTFNIAGCDISTGEMFVGTTDSIVDDMIRINPAEIIYPEKDAENQIIKNLRDTYKTTPVYEKLYIRSDINLIVMRVFSGNVKSDAVDGVSAITLLAGYLFNTQRGANITFRAPYDFKSGKQLTIDYATWKSLEIDAPINDGGVCLLDVLDRTKTAFGARKLRSYLRTLPADKDTILSRQEHIGHLLLNRSVMAEINDRLSRIPDVNRALSRLLSGRGTPRDMRNISEFLNILDSVRIFGQRLDTNLSEKFTNIKTHDIFAKELTRALADELPSFFRDGNVIKQGFNPALDNMRKLSNGAMETIAELQAKYIRETGINTLKIKYNNILGYFIEVPSARADTLMAPESGFIHRQTMAGNMRFTTAQLIDLIADVDVWLSLAECADLYSWTRPTITTNDEFDVTGGRHPVIEYVLRQHGNNFVKNDCNLNEKPIALLTGPNMAGKSTYLRQNAILVVLAHLGSFIPATSATIGICDQLFSRVGASDNLAAGQSTFMVEMVETANILNRATKKSFIIFDEIGRGTSTFDGMAIAQAVLEYLNTLKPRTLFATHYHELTRLVDEENLTGVSCLTIDVREHNNDIIFLHKIISGVANRSYGIAVAKMAGMPKNVVERAEQVLAGLESTPNNTIHERTKPSVKPVIEEPKQTPQLSLFE